MLKKYLFSAPVLVLLIGGILSAYLVIYHTDVENIRFIVMCVFFSAIWMGLFTLQTMQKKHRLNKKIKDMKEEIEKQENS